MTDATDRDSTYGLQADQIADLLDMGRNEETAESASPDKAELLRECLAGPVPAEAIAQADPSLVLQRMLQDVSGSGPRSLSEMLTEPATDLAMVQRLKEHAKRAAASELAEDQSLPVTIYYAAIAAGLRFHDARITNHSYAALADSFADLAAKEWMTPDLQTHFAQAEKICRQRASLA